MGPRESLRDKLVELSEEMYADGDLASDRKSYVEGNALRHSANRIREVLGLPGLTSVSPDVVARQSAAREAAIEE
jgi:hypothetical protein